MKKANSKQIIVVCSIVIFVAMLVTLMFSLFGRWYKTIEDAKVASGYASSEVRSIHAENIDDWYVDFVINESKDEISVVQIECKHTLLGERYKIVQTETVSMSKKIASYDKEQTAVWNQLLATPNGEFDVNMVWCIIRLEHRILEDSMVKVRFTYNDKPYVLCCKPSDSSVHVTGESVDKVREIQEVFYDYPESGYNIPYSLILPQDYDPRQKYPVLLFLHGEDVRGNDNTSHMFLADTMYEVASDWLEYAIFIAPQCPADSSWNINSDNDTDEKGTLGGGKTSLGVYKWGLLM